MTEPFVLVHLDQGHSPGTLYDCVLCESRCFCARDKGPMCVHCARVNATGERFRFECADLNCSAKQHPY